MNSFKLALVAALLIPPLSWAREQDAPAFGSNCGPLSQRLEKLDCTNAIPEGRKFLLEGHKLVLAIPRNAPSVQNEIATLRKGLQSHGQTMTDCLNKHRANKEYSSAILPFMKADFAVEKLSETPGMPRHAQEMLIHQYEEAMETVSRLD
jgi:hypothetical protein